MVGGVVCGALGFIFAPQISKALLGDDDRLKLRWDEAADGEVRCFGSTTALWAVGCAGHEVSSRGCFPASMRLLLLSCHQQVTKQNLADKIAQLNAAIDDVSSQLNSKEPATFSKDEVAAQ